jgi:hypothetical protein
MLSMSLYQNLAPTAMLATQLNHMLVRDDSRIAAQTNGQDTEGVPA